MLNFNKNLDVEIKTVIRVCTYLSSNQQCRKTVL